MDPAGDIGVIDIELIMADVEMVERRIDKAQKAAKGDKKYLREVEVFSALKDWLNDGNSARSFDCDEDDAAIIAAAELLSLKPIIYAANLDEEGFADCHANAYYKVVEELAAKEGAQVIPVCARSPSSPPARTSVAPGRSNGAPRPPRPRARSTPTLSGASSAPRWSTSTI